MCTAADIIRPVAKRFEFDVLVTCHRHADVPSSFPQVRGALLADALRRIGVAAAFAPLPAAPGKAEVVISSEYQLDDGAFARAFQRQLAELAAERYFCLIDESLSDHPDHFSRPYCDWFAQRGGVLFHLPSPRWLPGERWIGVAVDPSVIPIPAADRRRIIFDYPSSSPGGVPAEVVDAVAAARPDLVTIGSGYADDRRRTSMKGWVSYGQPHDVYVHTLLCGALAFVVGSNESLGLVVAEAQVAGAVVVHLPDQVKPAMACDGGTLECDTNDPASLLAALDAAAGIDPVALRHAAIARFDPLAMARRVHAAIG